MMVEPIICDGINATNLIKSVVICHRKKTKFNETDEQLIRKACVDFVAKDIRPFKAIEGGGLRCLLYTVLALMKKYPVMSKDDLDRLLPSRMTIAKDLNKKAQSIRQYISQLFL